MWSIIIFLFFFLCFFFIYFCVESE
jgi:hypothetical protein